MLNIIICEDDDIEREYVKNLLNEIIAEKKIPASIKLASGNTNDVIRYSNSNFNNDNIYILDIDFDSKCSGLDIAKIIRKKETKAYIIFITAHLEYVMLSFKTKTFDYLVKPINKEILQKTILSVVKDYNDINGLKKISIKFGGEIIYVNEDDIIYIEKVRTLLIIHTKKGDIRIYESLSALESKLDANKFIRTHRSYLVNIKYIDKISIKDSIVYLVNGDKCYISRSQKKRLSQYENII